MIINTRCFVIIAEGDTSVRVQESRRQPAARPPALQHETCTRKASRKSITTPMFPLGCNVGLDLAGPVPWAAAFSNESGGDR